MWAHYEVRTRALSVRCTGYYNCHSVFEMPQVFVQPLLELSTHGYTGKGGVLSNAKRLLLSQKFLAFGAGLAKNWCANAALLAVHVVKVFCGRFH